MIEFYSETDFELSDPESVSNWIQAVIIAEGFEAGDISYVFCDDVHLHKLNVEYLNHDTLTDIISFDYTLGKQIHGEIFISIDRVKENATTFQASFEEELHRVIIHGILHYCGYNDKTESEKATMRFKEEEALQQRSTV
jgi:rRNA maturation RNase YbeY